MSAALVWPNAQRNVWGADSPSDSIREVSSDGVPPAFSGVQRLSGNRWDGRPALPRYFFFGRAWVTWHRLQRVSWRPSLAPHRLQRRAFSVCTNFVRGRIPMSVLSLSGKIGRLVCFRDRLIRADDAQVLNGSRERAMGHASLCPSHQTDRF
jgi:hypothetical protein